MKFRRAAGCRHVMRVRRTAAQIVSCFQSVGAQFHWHICTHLHCYSLFQYREKKGFQSPLSGWPFIVWSSAMRKETRTQRERTKTTYARCSTRTGCSAVGATGAAGVANLKQIWDDLEPEEAFDMVPHCELDKVDDPALCRLELVISLGEHREHIRGALGQRSESSSRSSSQWCTGRGTVVSARTGQLARPDSPILPLSS